MGNISQPITRYLINSVNTKDWGLYLNGSAKILKYAKRGLDFPAASTTVAVSDYDPGKYKASFISFNKRPVAAGYPFELGLTFVKR